MVQVVLVGRNKKPKFNLEIQLFVCRFFYIKYGLILDEFDVNSQKQFDQMNENTGVYLANIFNEYDSVKIHLYNAGWRRDIYLPNLGSKEAKVIVQRDSNHPVAVHGPGIGKVEIPNKTTWTFYNKNGNWMR